jgi:hypothetical protein
MTRKPFFAAALLFAATPSLAQTLTPLTRPAPDGATVELLLTDGSVLVQSYYYSQWWRLIPDINGSYVNGHWVRASLLPGGYAPFGQSEAVLADGRVAVIGGEYNLDTFDLTNKCAIYDPVANAWSNLAPPTTWNYIGDSPLVVEPNGKLIVGDKLTEQMAELDPATLKWKKLAHTGKADFNSEEGWTLMPDGSFIALDVKNAPNTEVYNRKTETWQSLGSTPVDLHSPGGKKENYGGPHYYHPPGEIGPAFLMPDGSVFATGAIPQGSQVAHTAIYAGGQWRQGPDFPGGDEPADTFATMMPNGRPLITGINGTLYEYDGTDFITEPLNVAFSSLLVLPTGEVLVGGTEVYTSTGTYDPSWAPAITKAPGQVTRGTTYKISGTQFNGLSLGAVFGDELQAASNYPLVRITNTATGHVFYERTHDHSTMGVATGSRIVSTNFDVSSATETGPGSLVVVANGIPSQPVPVTVN